MEILCQRIKDQIFLELIRSLLKVKIILPENSIEKTVTGTPERGVFRPLGWESELDPII